MPSKEERYRNLLARIDGGARLKQLEVELKELQAAFMDRHSNAERVDALTKKHKSALDAAKKKEPDTKHVSREAILTNNEEQAGLMWLMVEHFAEEIEKAEGLIKEIKEAGLPKKKEETSE